MNSSKWKSPFQYNKRERAQPQSRDGLGLLEKKKDYILRARNRERNEKELKELQRAVELRNPDEFYFSMITDAKKKKPETKTKSFRSFSKEQKMLLQTQDISYVEMKLASCRKKLKNLKESVSRGGDHQTTLIRNYDELKTIKDRPDDVLSFDNAEYDESVSRLEKIIKDLEEVHYEMEIQRETEKDPNYKIVDGEPVWNRERKK